MITVAVPFCLESKANLNDEFVGFGKIWDTLSNSSFPVAKGYMKV